MLHRVDLPHPVKATDVITSNLDVEKRAKSL